MTVPLAAWRPALSVYVRRTALAGALTLGLMALAGWGLGTATGYWQVLYTGPVLALAYFILFDDPLRWRRVRLLRWQLTTEALIHHGPEGEGYIPLTEIADVRARLGHSVVVVLRGGMRLRLGYVSAPRDIAAQIRTARDRAIV